MNRCVELENIENFKLSFEKEIPDFIIDLKKYAKNNDVPIISDDVRDFLDIIIELIKPKLVLEIGTAIGYSSLVMAHHNDVAKIVTIENYKKRIKIAKSNFIKYDKKNKIELYFEDADIALNELVKNECVFDMIFLDCAKSQYINWLPNILKLMNNKCVFITDNVLNNLETLKSRYVLEKRSRSMHDNLKAFIKALKDNKQLYTKILNIGDGIAFAKKINDEEY